MKRRSEPKPPEDRVFFIDRSLGKKLVAHKLREAGIRCEVHDDHFPQNASDETWLTECGKRGWIVLTRDQKVRYRPAELAALKSAKVSAVILTGRSGPASEYADSFLKAISKIEKNLSTSRRPVIIRVTRTGAASLIDLAEPD